MFWNNDIPPFQLFTNGLRQDSEGLRFTMNDKNGFEWRLNTPDKSIVKSLYGAILS